MGNFVRDQKFFNRVTMDGNPIPDSELIEQTRLAFVEKVMMTYFFKEGNINKTAHELKISPQEVEKVIAEVSKEDKDLLDYRRRAYKQVIDRQLVLTIGTQDVLLKKISKLINDESTIDATRLSDIASALKNNYQVLLAMETLNGKNVDEQQAIVTEVKKLEDFE